MKVGELVRCPRCSTENPPEYRFCGMCGNPLENPAEADHEVKARSEPAPRQERVPHTPRPISGPSFLGLSDEPARGSFGEPSRDVNYLLDDYEVPPKRTYWRFTLIMIILLILGGLARLEYTQSGKAWIAPWSKQKPSNPIQASQPEQPPQSGPANPEQAQPQERANQNSQAGAPETSAATNAHPQPSSQSPPKETDLAPSGQPDNTKATNSQPTETQSGQAPTGENDKASEAAASEAAAPDSARPAQPTRRAKAKAAPEDTGTESAEDALVANAEKALYGRGVPQNCDRALSSLNTAARRENARARGLLGTMYATGHCVPRDLPTAYRWFALASRQQPDNVWVQRNLEMIWREMTPQEQQLATKLRQ